MKYDFSRFRNYGLWVSIASLILLLLQNCGVSVVPSEFNVIVNIILSIFVALGVINDPTASSKVYPEDSDSDKE